MRYTKCEKLEVCEDCLRVHASGIDSEEDKYFDLCLLEYLEDFGGTLELPGEVQEGFFSHSLCHVCAADAGTRYYLNARS